MKESFSTTQGAPKKTKRKLLAAVCGLGLLSFGLSEKFCESNRSDLAATLSTPDAGPPVIPDLPKFTRKSLVKKSLVHNREQIFKQLLQSIGGDEFEEEEIEQLTDMEKKLSKLFRDGDFEGVLRELRRLSR